jgi:hypothetical protein
MIIGVFSPIFRERENKCRVVEKQPIRNITEEYGKQETNQYTEIISKLVNNAAAIVLEKQASERNEKYFNELTCLTSFARSIMSHQKSSNENQNTNSEAPAS